LQRLMKDYREWMGGQNRMTEDSDSLRKTLENQFNSADIIVGEMAMHRFDNLIQSDLQRNYTLKHLLEEMMAAKQAIDEKYTNLARVLGAPLGNVQFGKGDGLGFYREYEHGAIFWRRDLGSHGVYGIIYKKYRALGAEGGFLGYPTTDRTLGLDGIGAFNHFEGGSIYWHPAAGAHEVHGAIRAKWQALGSEAFGYPLCDESQAMKNENGRFNHFRRILPDRSRADASIYWSPETNAQAIVGAIRSHWADLGWESSYLGYPVTDELPWTDPETNKPGRISHFARGAIGWTAEDQQIIAIPERIILRSGHIGVSSVGGWVELILSSAGTFNYRGHLHNSGFVGMYCEVQSAVKIGNTTEGISPPRKEVNVGGTTSVFDDRDEDWDDNGYSDIIRDNWENLRTQWKMETMIASMMGAFEVFFLIFLPIMGIATINALASGPGRDSNGWCCNTSGMHTVKDGNNNTIAEPDGVRCRPPPCDD
jgi:LGFP repeat